MLAHSKAAFAPVGELLNRAKQKAAITEAMTVVAAANKYLSDTAPWKLKGEDDRARQATILHTALQLVDDCKALLTPFLPHSSQKVHELLGNTGEWSGSPRIDQVSEEGNDDYSVLQGDYKTAAACGRRARSRPGPSWRPRRRSSPSSTPRSWKRSSPAWRPRPDGGARTPGRRRTTKDAAPPAPEPLEVAVPDSHTHLDLQDSEVGDAVGPPRRRSGCRR